MWTVENVFEADERRQICADIIATLPGWFGIPDANAFYVEGVGTRHAFVVRDEGGSALGMLSLAHPYPTNAYIYWLGVKPEHHRKGIGVALFAAALTRADDLGCNTMTVETLSEKDSDEGYARTRAWYEAMGFRPLFDLRPTGDFNPLVYMMKQL